MEICIIMNIYVGKVSVGELGFFINGTYFLDGEVPTILPKLNMMYGSYRTHPYSHMISKNRMGEFRKLLYSHGGCVR